MGVGGNTKIANLQKVSIKAPGLLAIKGNLVFVELFRLKYCHHRFFPSHSLSTDYLITILRMFGLWNKMN